MNRMVVSVLLAPALLGASASYAGADWTQAWVAGTESCARVCAAAKARPVTSGTYAPNGNAFHVCRANQNNEGKRAGYNVEPVWSQACIVGWDGQEVFATPYECLCQR
ncbi:MAG TPA: hypothetical protein VFY73_17385 [Ideonella sp.]|uniref:hypothetical protein n=1 Tax=Ideonella sp. TaxID=1929293 RepID=UPI002E2EC149|nr:hypothetical protein [Ideonella sp.]HEX5685799.1 hypothetical protein [Ideonella sp.]